MRSRLFIFITAGALVCTMTTAYSKDFDIAFLDPDTDSLSSDIQVLVAGGYVHGLEKGMQGAVFSCGKDDDTVIVGTGEIVDVSKYESSCLVQRSGEQRLRIGHKVDLEPPEANQEMFVETGRQAFDAEDFERAEFFLSTALRHATPEDSLQITPLVEKSKSMVEKELKRRLRRKEKKQEESNKTAYLLLAQNYLAAGEWAPADYYFKKLLRIDSSDKRVKNIIERIDELRDFDPEETGQAVIAEVGYPPDSVAAEIRPKMIKRPPPVYPEDARRIGWQGVIWVKAFVAKTGKVLIAKADKSSGFSVLDDAAVTAAYGSEYRPAVKNGKAVNCWVTYKIDFKLNDGSGSLF